MQLNPTHTALFEPHTFATGHMVLPNRLVLAPMTTYSSHPDGTISREELAFLERRARGLGMVMTAACYVIHHGHAFDGQWSCATETMVPSLRAAATAIKRGGALAVLQIHHGGRLSPASILGHEPLAPSAVPARRAGADTPRAMTEAEIEETIKAFGQAARRAILAGYDGVEIHGANSYLLQQFFSPHANRRTDQWGGTVENRAAFPIAVLEEVQEIVRRNAYRPFAIGYRLSPEEVEEPGISLHDTMQLVEGIVACRPDWIHISTNDYFAGSIRASGDRVPRAKLIAERVRKRATVIGVGSIYTPDSAVRVLADGVDLVALGRSMIIEPEWPAKVECGDIRGLRACLPPVGAESLLDIPPGMYRRILGRPGWLPLCPPSADDGASGDRPQTTTAPAL